MKWLLILILIFQASMSAKAQEVDWSKTRNWKIYALNNNEAYFYSVDTLYNFKNARMDDSSVTSYLSHAIPWSKGKSGTWMGLYIASYETPDRQIRKVVISSYGGFLFDSWSRRYYELPKELRKSWNDFIMENLQKVFE
jgi:hypothetical protein